MESGNYSAVNSYAGMARSSPDLDSLTLSKLNAVTGVTSMIAGKHQKAASSFVAVKADLLNEYPDVSASCNVAFLISGLTLGYIRLRHLPLWLRMCSCGILSGSTQKQGFGQH